MVKRYRFEAVQFLDYAHHAEHFESDDGDWIFFDEHKKEINRLEEQNKALRESLQFYARPQTYRSSNLKKGEDFSCAPLLTDRGRKAREALK